MVLPRPRLGVALRTAGCAAACAGLVAIAVAGPGCREAPARFTVQQEGEHYFVREAGGAFSVLLPCRPEPSAAPAPGGVLAPIQLACDRQGQRLSVTRLPHATLEDPSFEPAPLAKIYETAMRQLEGWRGAARSDSSVRRVAGRPAQYVAFAQLDGAATAAHVWLVWVEEQRALYQVMVVGDGGPAPGEALARTLLVPSP